MSFRNTLSLQYLHNEKLLLHGDMKSCNVVIKGDFETVKICDVGVSLQLDENMKGKFCVCSRDIALSFSIILKIFDQFYI